MPAIEEIGSRQGNDDHRVHVTDGVADEARRRAAVYPLAIAGAMTAAAEGSGVKTMLAAFLGSAIGFLATVLAIGAIVLLVIGVAGGILVRERPGTARILNYDPSDTVLKAGVTGVAALFLIVVFIAVSARLKRGERRDLRAGRH